MKTPIFLSALIWITLAAHGDEFKLRAGYLGIRDDRAVLEKMRNAGMNAAWVKMGNFATATEQANSLRELDEWATACEKAGIWLWPVVNFVGGDADLESLPDFRHEVSEKGHVMRRTPCPVDERFWRQVIFPRFLRIAEAAKARPVIAGAILDPEMYGADHTAYTSPCYCEACRKGARSASAAALAAWQAQESERICRELERAVHMRNPRLRFGVFHLDTPARWHEGIARGLGTMILPVVCGSEKTYSTGMTTYVEQARTRFQRLGANVSFASGLWIREFPTENIAEQLYALGRVGGGYWIFTLQSLARPAEEVEKKMGQDYQLAEPHEKYWAAIKLANDELNKSAAARGNYQSPLKIRPFQVPPRPISMVGIGKRQLTPVSQAQARLPLAGRETQLRGKNVILVNVAAGESLRFTVSTGQVGKYPDRITILVLDPEGKEMRKETLQVGTTQSVEIPGVSAGTHTLICEAGMNRCLMTLANPHVVYLATKKQPLSLYESIRRLYFSVPENAKAEVEVWTQSDKEAVTARLFSPVGKLAVEKVVVGSEILSASGEAGVWSVTCEKAPMANGLYSVRLHLLPPLQPYLADAIERLMKE